MESFLKEMPQFKSPEEELSYLRNQVAEREKVLEEKGHFENASEHASTEVITEYAQLPKEAVLHKALVIPDKKADEIVLKLKPEAHDVVMEEVWEYYSRRV